jgi:hypothetical protein
VLTAKKKQCTGGKSELNTRRRREKRLEKRRKGKRRERRGVGPKVTKAEEMEMKMMKNEALKITSQPSSKPMSLTWVSP